MQHRFWLWRRLLRGTSSAAVVLMLSIMAAPAARADELVQCGVTGPSQTTCRISEPNVRAKISGYPQVTFSPGDRVLVMAGGCVQTGGFGPTWKRYVRPTGPDSDRLYWGTIDIPGATNGVVRLSAVVGRTLPVAAAGSLRLGYVDDTYHDNGYDSHDDGTDNQCAHSVNAFVSLTIDHASAQTATCGGNTGAKLLDLVWTNCDPNGFPLNPRWRSQVNDNGLVPSAPSRLCPAGIQSCTSWPLSYDNPGLIFAPALCDSGHVNFFAATYSGPLSWEDKSHQGTDDDYNYRIEPPNDAGGLTTLGEMVNGFEIEHDSDETIDHFQSPLWTQFHARVRADNTAAQHYLSGKTAIVTGLFGLDCGHPDCSSELHPAYAMAIDMENSDLGDDKWAVFARNWGNEGYCSSDQHNLSIDRLRLLIPWLAGATSVTVLPATQFHMYSSAGKHPVVLTPRVVYARSEGVLVEFSLPDASNQVGFDGEVHLKWQLSQTYRGTIATRSAMISQRQRPLTRVETDKPEDRLAAVLARMPAGQSDLFAARIATAKHAGQPVTLFPPVHPVPLALTALPRAARLASPLAPHSVHDAVLARKRSAQHSALCAAFGGNVPGYRFACGSASPVRRSEPIRNAP